MVVSVSIPEAGIVPACMSASTARRTRASAATGRAKSTTVTEASRAAACSAAWPGSRGRSSGAGSLPESASWSDATCRARANPVTRHQNERKESAQEAAPAPASPPCFPGARAALGALTTGGGGRSPWPAPANPASPPHTADSAASTGATPTLATAAPTPIAASANPAAKARTSSGASGGCPSRRGFRSAAAGSGSSKRRRCESCEPALPSRAAP